MFKLQKFVPLQKVDTVNQIVYGILAEEAVDKSGEIMDYATSVPYFKSWNEQFSKAISPDGVPSVGNLRSMHKTVAAGKFIDMTYDDVNKQIHVAAKVVDKDEWAKVEAGVYTGFSIGGKYLKVWQDGDYLRYTAKPSEGSLVDNPCMYGATFTAVKGEGLEEVIKFAGSGEKVEKSLYEISDLAGCLRCLNYVRLYLKDEAEYEGDGSTIPNRLRDAVVNLSSILVDLCQEETAELVSDEVDKMDAAQLKKAFEEVVAPLQADLAAVKTKLEAVKTVTHPENTGTVAKTEGADLTKVADLEKSVTSALAKVDGLEKTVNETVEAVKEIGKAMGELTEVVNKYLAQPEPSRAAVNGKGAPVTKDADNGAAPDATKDAKPEDLIKGILSSAPMKVL